MIKNMKTNKKIVIAFFVIFFIAGLYTFIISPIIYKENTIKLKNNFSFLTSIILAYSTDHGEQFPLPEWLFENPTYFTGFFEKHFKGKIKGEQILEIWSNIPYDEQILILNGEIKLERFLKLTESMKQNPIIWIMEERGKNNYNKPFFINMQEYYRKEEGKMKFKDPFSKTKNTIRYSMKYISNEFCLISDGPDGVSNIDEKQIFGEDLYKSYNPPKLNQVYDPTNGLKSEGDIIFHYNWQVKYLEDTYQSIPAFRELYKK